MHSNEHLGFNCYNTRNHVEKNVAKNYLPANEFLFFNKSKIITLFDEAILFDEAAKLKVNIKILLSDNILLSYKISTLWTG